MLCSRPQISRDRFKKFYILQYFFSPGKIHTYFRCDPLIWSNNSWISDNFPIYFVFFCFTFEFCLQAIESISLVWFSISILKRYYKKKQIVVFGRNVNWFVQYDYSGLNVWYRSQMTKLRLLVCFFYGAIHVGKMIVFDWSIQMSSGRWFPIKLRFGAHCIRSILR